MIEAAGGGHTVEVNTTTEISRATDFEALQMRPLPAGERQAVMALLGRHVLAIRRYFVNKVRRADDVDALVDAVKRLMGKTSPWFGRCRRFAAHLFAVQQVVLRRYYGLCLVEASKTRLADHHKNSEPVAEPVFAPSYVIEAKEEEAPEAPTIVAEMQTAIATLSVSEAVMRMDLAGLPALMFTNSKHGGLNMVYRRADGHIGWIDPAGNAKTTAAG